MTARSWLSRARGSVRLRMTLLAGGLFAVTLLVASVVLLRALENRLVADIRRADQEALATQVVQLEEEGIPEGADVVPYGDVELAEWCSVDQCFRIPVEFDESGHPTPAAGVEEGHFVSERDLIDAEDFPQGAVISGVFVEGTMLSTVSSLDDMKATIATTGRLLWLIGPALVALVAGMAWLLAGRALRPVRTMTSRVAAIESQSLHERVPEPVSGDEVAELARTMNQMLGRLERASETSRRLVSDASHELRTPVAVMRTELEVARRVSTNDWSETSDVLLGELDRLQHLVDDLLLLARGDERGLARDDVDLDAIVGDVVSRRRAPGDSHAALASHSEQNRHENLVIKGDSHALSRAFDHLMANAARSASERVSVTIERSDAGEIAVHVDDDGPGIPEAHRANVVRRFVRLDEGRTRDAGGAGLGLAVASDVAAGHDGRLEITDSPLGGARVTIVLPRT
jgi:signal transduction histidine kinase